MTCRFDGYLEHVGMLLAKCYNDIDKVVDLLCCGDIESLRYDLQHTIFENPLNYEHPSECDMKIADGVGDYLLNVEGDYKYLYDNGKWYVVDGLYDEDGITPIKRPILVAWAMEMGYW